MISSLLSRMLSGLYRRLSHGSTIQLGLIAWSNTLRGATYFFALVVGVKLPIGMLCTVQAASMAIA
jgi:hypothetical protein